MAFLMCKEIGKKCKNILNIVKISVYLYMRIGENEIPKEERKMKLVIEDYGNNVYATLNGETLVKQWLDGEFTERKLNTFVKKLQKNYRDEIEIVRKVF